MERRRCRRITVNLKAERISGSASHTVFIENISDHGIQIITTHAPANTRLAPGTDLDLNLSLAPGRTIRLRCMVRWSFSKTPPDGLTDSIGLEIVDPPIQYIDFVKTLN